MKKTAAVLLIVFLFNSLSACAPVKKARKEKAPASAFAFDYKTDKKNVDYFADNDSINTLMAATPFYAGNQPLPNKSARAFEKARAKKVEEIKKEADLLVKHTGRVEPQLAKMRRAYLDYLTETLKLRPKLKNFTKDAFSRISLNYTKERLLKIEYRGIRPAKGNKYAEAFQDYLKVTKAVELGTVYLRDINDISALAALSLKALEKDGGPKIKAANAKLDKKMAVLDEMTGDLQAVAESLGKIDYGLRQLETGDHYLAAEGDRFMAANLPELKKKAKALKPRPGLTQRDIKFINDYLEFMGKFRVALKKQSDKIDKGRLIEAEKPKKTSAISYAWADSGPPASATGQQVLQAPAQGGEAAEGMLSKGWRGIKAAVRGAKTTVGVTADVLGVAARNLSQIPLGIYYGNKPSEIWEDMQQNTRIIKANYRKGISGASTFNTAGEYLEGVEKGAGEAVAKGFEETIGKGWTSWAAYGLTKTTVGMFTGLGKGIYKVAKTDATTIELVEGTMDIGFSFIGGSKVIIKGSQVPGLLKGLAQQGKLLGQEGLALVKDMANAADKRAIAKEMAALLSKNKLAQAEVAALIKHSIELEAREAVAQAIKQTRAQILKDMIKILKEGGKSALESSTSGIKSSLDDLLSKVFQKNLAGYRDVLNTVAGATGTDYLDNLVGSWLDDYIKGLVKEALQEAPGPAEVSGNWTGTLTITDINESAGDDKDGCDLNLSQLKGRAMPLAWNIALDGGGNGTVSGGTGDNTGSGAARYSDGVLVVNQVKNGAHLHLEGPITRTESGGYTAGGNFVVSMKGTWALRGNWTATKK